MTKTKICVLYNFNCNPLVLVTLVICFVWQSKCLHPTFCCISVWHLQDCLFLIGVFYSHFCLFSCIGYQYCCHKHLQQGWALCQHIHKRKWCNTNCSYIWPGYKLIYPIQQWVWYNVKIIWSLECMEVTRHNRQGWLAARSTLWNSSLHCCIFPEEQKVSLV